MACSCAIGSAISLDDQEINSPLPQLQFYSRVNDIIDIGTLARFTERDIWAAVHDTGLPYTDWVARKEVLDTHPQLHIYIEPQAGADFEVGSAKQMLDQHLSSLVSEYTDLKAMFNYDPLLVSELPVGAFDAYMKAQVELGADLAHIKPPHMQPSDKVLERLRTL